MKIYSLVNPSQSLRWDVRLVVVYIHTIGKWNFRKYSITTHVQTQNQSLFSKTKINQKIKQTIFKDKKAKNKVLSKYNEHSICSNSALYQKNTQHIKNNLVVRFCRGINLPPPPELVRWSNLYPGNPASLIWMESLQGR